MKKPALLLLLVLPLLCFAQPYQPDWASLDKRPVPQWFRDAKFGIFIHWGVYSVPGWSTKGNYAEWYQQGLQTTDKNRQAFHQSKFGERTYYQLANDFKAELYQPDEWAKLFERSGAKYIVLTSKHHDGFALWPSKEASGTWGFPWNALEVGPKRDLLGDLFTAVRKTSVRAGMYYSLYEWFNPLWKKDPSSFAAQHTWPQMKDLIHTYEPDVFWTDGDWDATAETWKSQQFIAWLYNESPVKDKIVINDRWGSGVRFKHGGIYTPEYQPDLDFEDHYWEESRGMGYSYGYNREEDAWDYNSTQSLVIALIDKVSRGGNFLLDIGPDEHGKIPPIMQERLLEIGDWLAVNGDAIYGTTRWKKTVQWSEGKKDFKAAHGVSTDWNHHQDIMLKQTVDPDPGYAVKELFYTYKPATNTLYAIFPRYPSSKKLSLNDLVLPEGTRIRFLSKDGQPLSWSQQGSAVVVDLPEYDPNAFKSTAAYVLEIGNYGRFTAKPAIEVTYAPGALKPVITLRGEGRSEVHYTMDGTLPDATSARYTGPIVPQASGVVRAIAVNGEALPSGVAQQDFNVYEWMKPVQIKNVLPGLRFSAHEWTPQTTAEIDAQKAVKEGVAGKVDAEYATRKENVGLRFDGYFKATKDALYTFYLNSDDGSRLFIDGREVINHDGFHGNDEKEGAAALKKGYHRLRVDYFQATGGIGVGLKYSCSGIPKQEAAGKDLFYNNK
ncbi:MAG: hypothetical protein RJA57_1294 [Bacteroidota bacterium]